MIVYLIKENVIKKFFLPFSVQGNYWITDIDNNKYIYEVKIIEILSPNDIEEMIESEFDLTLYTCTKDNLNRVTVRLNKIK